MNTKEIERFIGSDTVSRQVFQGFYSVDTLPPDSSLLGCNTDPSTKPGLHWIVIHVDKNGRGEYFDSSGRAPNKHFESYRINTVLYGRLTRNNYRVSLVVFADIIVVCFVC